MSDFQAHAIADRVHDIDLMNLTAETIGKVRDVYSFSFFIFCIIAIIRSSKRFLIAHIASTS